jgi:hypothetical protein
VEITDDLDQAVITIMSLSDDVEEIATPTE